MTQLHPDDGGFIDWSEDQSIYEADLARQAKLKGGIYEQAIHSQIDSLQDVHYPMNDSEILDDVIDWEYEEMIHRNELEERVNQGNIYHEALFNDHS